MIGTLIIGAIIGMMVETLAIIGIVAYFARDKRKEELSNYYGD